MVHSDRRLAPLGLTSFEVKTPMTCARRSRSYGGYTTFEQSCLSCSSEPLPDIRASELFPDTDSEDDIGSSLASSHPRGWFVEAECDVSTDSDLPLEEAPRRILQLEQHLKLDPARTHPALLGQLLPNAEIPQKADLADKPEVTTLMIQNLPGKITQPELLELFNRAGFVGLYDFCWLPHGNKGFAFVNFTSPPAASAFKASWQGKRLIVHGSKALRVVDAKCQGLEANLNCRTTAPKGRTSKSESKPFVLQECFSLVIETKQKVPSRQTPVGIAPAPRRHT